MSTKQGHSQKTQPIKLTLENIRELLEILNNPHLKLKTIHVAGTNGKGSVCAYLSSVLFHAGYKVRKFHTVPFSHYEIFHSHFFQMVYDDNRQVGILHLI
jgi:folylpolyglutamate synthase/dihydropteroate synthase